MFTPPESHSCPEFFHAALHDDQEGFFVLEGSGEAQLAGELYTLHKGMSFILPPQTLHSFRRLGSEYLKVLWFHAAP